MPLNDFASRGIQCHGMEFRIQGHARSTIPRVRRGASSSHESKDNKGLAFKVFWCFEVHAFVACPGILGPSGAGITRGHGVEVSLKRQALPFPPLIILSAGFRLLSSLGSRSGFASFALIKGKIRFATAVYKYGHSFRIEF